MLKYFKIKNGFSTYHCWSITYFYWSHREFCSHYTWPNYILVWTLALHQTSIVASNFSFLAITFSVAIGIFILDYFIPMIGAKKFGGTKSGIIGATVGLIVGMMIIGPLGFFIGTFFGALIGELIHDPSNKGTAIKSALGSLIGFLTGVFLKFSVSMVYGIYLVKILFENQF